MSLTRRRLLAYGAAGTGLLALGGGLSWVTLGYRLPPRDVALGLSVKELAVVRAFVDAVVPPDGDLPGGLELGVHQRIDEEVWSAAPPMAADLRAAIQVIEHLPPLFGFLGRFTRLSREDRQAAVVAMLTSDLGPVVQAAGGLRQLSLMFTYAADGSWPGIGYDGPWVGTPRPPESTLHYARLLADARSAP